MIPHLPQFILLVVGDEDFVSYASTQQVGTKEEDVAEFVALGGQFETGHASRVIRVHPWLIVHLALAAMTFIQNILVQRTLKAKVPPFIGPVCCETAVLDKPKKALLRQE